MCFMLKTYLLHDIFYIIYVILMVSVSAVIENHISAFNDKVMIDYSTLLETTNAESVSVCSEFCFDQTECTSYFYNTNIHQCQIYSVSFGDPTHSSVLSETGWVYYQVFDNIGCYSSPGYIQHRGLGLCYKFRVDPDTLNVTEFRLLCAADNAELIAITSDAIQNHISAYLKQFGTTFILIQGSDAITEGTWLLDDGTAMTYFNWGPDGQPFDPDYLYLYKSYNYDLGTGGANYGASGGYICNKKLH